VVFLVTTTKNRLDPENETRLLSLEVDDSETQTRRVLRKVARIEGLNYSPQRKLFKPWHAYQRWLAAGDTDVTVPFAAALAELVKGTHTVRWRRDFGQLLRAIAAHALLHREHRRRDDDGYIVATIGDDYATVRGLMEDLLAASTDLKIRQQIADTVKAVEELDSGDGVKVRQVAYHLRLDMNTARRRLGAAEAAGLVKDAEPRKGRGHTARYASAQEEIAPKGHALPKPDDLAAAYDKGEQAKRAEVT
jgi:hypothetical protein